MSGIVVRMAELDILPSALADYCAELALEIEASLANEPGVLALQAASDREHPHRIRILEVYQSADAYEAHLKTPHFLRYKAVTASAVMSLRLIPLDPVRVLSRPLDLARPATD